MSLPSRALPRPSLLTHPKPAYITHQTRHATLLHRPQTPYTFTQLITLSDGSTYLTRTTSPAPIHKSTKDVRNHALWQPSLSSLRNVEQDEAGRLRAFRMRFGRGWDLDAATTEEGGEVKASADGKGVDADAKAQEEEDSLMDLISGSAAPIIETKEYPKGKKGKGSKKK
ncbi:hypothetical protein HYFRA_00002822 [Hymenoscyphus fraxineus]|uniref:Ribosomal protein bL31m N-terminal domain-containing protein n=1 Tax=Hymenoscyphus fraxineus TaxID=746836 RepID=A0A9N9KRA7_9HELO|nr:hypothetical protein HYFRA_00002822 [Hymenoscyphus fraxineus]